MLVNFYQSYLCELLVVPFPPTGLVNLTPYQTLQCQLDGRPLSTVTAVDTADGGALAEVAYEVVGGKETSVNPAPSSLSFSLSPGDTNHILLNEETGELSLGFAPIDYEDPLERSFSLSVKAIDNPNGPVTRQQKVNHLFSPSLFHTRFLRFHPHKLSLCSLWRRSYRLSLLGTAMTTLQCLAHQPTSTP